MKEFEKLSLQEKIDVREHTIKEMRTLNDGCKDEKGEVRAFTAEEDSKYKAMSEDVRKLTDLIAKEKRELELKGFTSSVPFANPEGGNGKNGSQLEAFRHYLCTGEIRADMDKRTLSVDDSGAAAVLAPQELVKQILSPAESKLSLLDRVYTVHLSKASGIGVPYEKTDASDADWTTEIPESIKDDEDLEYAKRELGAHMLIKLITVSDKTLKTNAFNVEQLIADKLSYKMRSALEKGIVAGTGTGQPLGLFVASAKGISTARDIAAASATALDGDDIIKAKRSVKSVYRSRGEWLFHPDTVTKLLTLKDKNGQYIWRSGLTVNDPDTLDGSPVIESEFAPAEMATGAYVGMFGDYSKYWMTMVDSIAIRRLEEKYYPSVGFSAKTYADGQPVLEEAFCRIKMG